MHRRAFLSKAIRGTALIGMYSSAMPAQAQVRNLNEAINKAGRQRMLSQRMAKAWLALGQGIIENKQAAKILSDSMALFDRQFVELKAYAPTTPIKATYEALEGVWNDYKTALVGTHPQKINAPTLLRLDAQVLKLAHQGTVQLEAYSEKTVGRLVNIAGRQRMLSQRTAKFYLSQQWGVNYPDAVKELNLAKAEFVAALNVLESAPQATPHILQKLTLARQQWVFFNNALTKLDSRIGAEQRCIEVFATSEHILQVMDQVTGLYSQLS
jgi:nitrate/nitrite-specific signal transduction histidine kinase